MDGILCSVDVCDRDVYSGSLCRKHYDQRNRGTLGVYITRPKYCMHPLCDEKHEARGLCRSHYKQYLNEGLELPLEVGRNIRKCSIVKCSDTCYGQTIFCKLHAEEKGVSVTKISANNRSSCLVDGCEKPNQAAGLCGKHYQETIRRRQGKRINIQGRVGCAVSGCTSKHKAKGYCQRHYSITKTFGIDPQVYENLLAAQSGLCAVCKQPPGVKGLHLDHNHQTLEVRALLCNRCNATLGLFNENHNHLNALAEYAKTDGRCITTRCHGIYTNPIPVRDR